MQCKPWLCLGFVTVCVHRGDTGCDVGQYKLIMSVMSDKLILVALFAVSRRRPCGCVGSRLRHGLGSGAIGQAK